jgi:hypothetical protein
MDNLMIKTKINMIGGGFHHEICSSALNVPKYVEWVKDGSAKISIHIDEAIMNNVDDNKINYGWVCESSDIVPKSLYYIKDNLEECKKKFKYIFTHDKSLLNIDPNFFKYTLGSTRPWIMNKKLYNKTKLCSFIVSNKKLTNGHNYRLSVLEKYKDKVDFFGRGTSKELPWSIDDNGNTESGKIIGLKDYMFSFVFENSNYETAMSEKVTDCFAVGTIPIFWGAPDIGDFYNIDGIILYDDKFDFSILNSEYYYSKIESVKDNLDRSINSLCAEDYFFINYIDGKY